LGSTVYGGSVLVGPWTFHPLTIMFILSGTLMISKTLRVPKP
jgi:CDP-diacylglycerol--serine O-phosphatidyltransferase